MADHEVVVDRSSPDLFCTQCKKWKSRTQYVQKNNMCQACEKKSKRFAIKASASMAVSKADMIAASGVLLQDFTAMMTSLLKVVASIATMITGQDIERTVSNGSFIFDMVNPQWRNFFIKYAKGTINQDTKMYIVRKKSWPPKKWRAMSLDMYEQIIKFIALQDKGELAKFRCTMPPRGEDIEYVSPAHALMVISLQYFLPSTCVYVLPSCSLQRMHRVLPRVYQQRHRRRSEQPQRARLHALVHDRHLQGLAEGRLRALLHHGGEDGLRDHRRQS